MKLKHLNIKLSGNKLQIIFSLFLIFVLNACKEDNFSQTVWDSKEEMLISRYLESREDQSTTLKMLKKAKLYYTLNSYGPYTLFAPNNKAWQKYLSSKNYNSIDDIDENTAKLIMEYHIITKEIKAETFQGGALRDTTVNGDNLRLDLSNGINKTVFNGSSNILDFNNENWNGIVHVIDKVLDPPLVTIGEYLSSNDEYKLFADMLKEYGLLDTLSKIRSSIFPFEKNKFTIFTPTNKAVTNFKKIINEMKKYDNEYEDKAKDPTYAKYNIPHKVKRFLAAHIMPDLIYTSEFQSGIFPTLAEVRYDDKVQKIKIKADADNILINDELAPLIKSNSDIMCKNGIIHIMEQEWKLLPRPPVKLTYSAYPETKWISKDGAYIRRRDYYNLSGYIDDDNIYGMIGFHPNYIDQSAEITIPEVVKGKYNIYMVFKANGVGYTRFELDGTPITDSPYLEKDNSYDWTTAKGAKRVDVKGEANPCSKYPMYMKKVFIGTAEVPQTKDVVMKFICTQMGTKDNMWLSAIILDPYVE